MYIVTVRLSSVGEPPPDAAGRFQAALWSTALPSDQLVHVYAKQVDGGMVAAIFIRASTLEVAEHEAHLMSQDAIRVAGLDCAITACGATLIMSIVESMIAGA
jgi:hypothetical protein